MEKNGLEILRTKNSDLNIELGLLPSIFRVFLSNYKVGRGVFNLQRILINGDFIDLTCLNYFNKSEGKGVTYENTISYFFSTEELRKEIERYNNKVDLYHKEGLIKIGLFDINDSILLGIEKNNRDEIWNLSGDWGDTRPEMQKMSPNIFCFLAKCKEVIINMNLKVRNIELKNLYKNWDEDFWRVREKAANQES